MSGSDRITALKPRTTAYVTRPTPVTRLASMVRGSASRHPTTDAITAMRNVSRNGSQMDGRKPQLGERNSAMISRPRTMSSPNSGASVKPMPPSGSSTAHTVIRTTPTPPAHTVHGVRGFGGRAGAAVAGRAEVAWLIR